MHYLECTADQIRQYIDSESAFRSHAAALKEAAELRGSMRWKEVDGRRYLVRSNSRGAEHSLGPQSPESEAIYTRFMQRKESAQGTLRARKERLELSQRLNKAHRVGRVPDVVVGILGAIEEAGIADQFMTVGTHALYAYESRCGVRVTSGALATQDIDLLFDTRKHLAFVSTLKRIDSSFIGVLRRADKTFATRSDQLQTAINRAGFEVDVIRRKAKDGDKHPLRMSDDESDLWAVQIDSGDALLSSRRFEQMVVGANGSMAMMKTVHPLDFIRVKRALSRSPTRSELKRPRDALQADIAEALWNEYLGPQEASLQTEDKQPSRTRERPQ